MAQVPYTGVPSVAPQLDPTPRFTADATPAAFGVNVWQAVQGLGQTEGKVGDEVFARGLAMQDLYNHSEAQQAATNFMEKAGDIHEKLKSLQGSQAVDYFNNGFKQDLQDARNGIRDNLSNDMSRKLYDSESLSMYGRTVFNGAGIAGEQNRQFALGASNARIQALKNNTLANAADEDAFQDNMQDMEDEIRTTAPMTKGQSPEAVDQAVAQAKSGLWSDRIRGLVKTQPITAGKMLDQAVKDGDVQGEDIAKLTNLVQASRNTVGARMISHDVMSGAGMRWGQGPVDIHQAQEAIGTFESGGNYSITGPQTSHGQALGKYQVMTENLPEFLAKAGLPSMTPEEFLRNPSAQDQVFASVFGGYMKQTGNFNDAASMWFSGKPVAQAGAVRDANGTSVPAYLAGTNAILARNAPLSAKVDMATKMATEQVPDDPLFQDYVRDRVTTDNNKQLAIKRDTQWQMQQPIENVLTGGGQGAKIPTTMEELRADPKASEGLDWLAENNPAKLRYYTNILAKNAKGDHALTPETLKQYTGFTGEAINRPADFVNEDILGTDLPITKKAELIKLQQSIQGKTDQGNPAVMQAVRENAEIIHAAGITTQTKDDYDQLTGAIADQLRQYSVDNKKPPNFEERHNIVSRLLQPQSTPGRFFGTNEYPAFQVPVPSDVAAEAKRLDPTLTDTEIQRRFTSKYYQKQFGKSATTLIPVSK